jgi:hypothetical protein
MIRLSAAIWAGLVVVAGLFLYQVKHDVQALEAELAGLNRRILAAQDRIHVLRAEWSLLNEPARLGDLARRHLALAPMRPDQFVRPADIAERVALHRPAPVETPAEPHAPSPVAIAAAERPALPLPPPFPPDPPRRAIATPPPPERSQPQELQPRAVAARPAAAERPARAADPPAPRPVAEPPVRTAALPPRPEPPAAPPAASALGAPAAALPPPVPRGTGGPR